MENNEETTAAEYPELESELETPEEDDQPVTTQSQDWVISALREKYERGRIDLQPDFQRQYVWPAELESRLIESLLLDIPVPPLYFAKMSGGHLEVIDGQQRLTAMMRFVQNEFPLQKLQRMSSLVGDRFRDLSEEQQDKVLDSPIRCVVVDTGARPDLSYEVFERLNRGSVNLNEQELRNSIYRGPFNELLANLEEHHLWRKVKGGNPEPRYKEREIILRFFAFTDRINHYKGNLKRFLNEYMGTHAPSSGQGINEKAEAFKQTMRNIHSVFGDKSARLYIMSDGDEATVEGRWDKKFSVSALDIQASALINHDNGKVQEASEQIREAYIFYLFTNPEVREAIRGQTSSTEKTKTRWFGFKAQVQDIISGTQTEPRFFDYEFRRELYERSPVCRLCGNEIHSFDDCTVDHIHPYSKGGKTTPENAQLAHRSCNARKYVGETLD